MARSFKVRFVVRHIDDVGLLDIDSEYTGPVEAETPEKAEEEVRRLLGPKDMLLELEVLDG